MKTPAFKDNTEKPVSPERDIALKLRKRPKKATVKDIILTLNLKGRRISVIKRLKLK